MHPKTENGEDSLTHFWADRRTVGACRVVLPLVSRNKTATRELIWSFASILIKHWFIMFTLPLTLFERLTLRSSPFFCPLSISLSLYLFCRSAIFCRLALLVPSAAPPASLSVGGTDYKIARDNERKGEKEGWNGKRKWRELEYFQIR